jgi:hypothetical protein
VIDGPAVGGISVVGPDGIGLLGGSGGSAAGSVVGSVVGSADGELLDGAGTSEAKTGQAPARMPAVIAAEAARNKTCFRFMVHSPVESPNHRRVATSREITKRNCWPVTHSIALLRIHRPASHAGRSPLLFHACHPRGAAIAAHDIAEEINNLR